SGTGACRMHLQARRTTRCGVPAAGQKQERRPAEEDRRRTLGGSMALLTNAQKKTIIAAVKNGSPVNEAAAAIGVKLSAVQAAAGGDSAFAKALAVGPAQPVHEVETPDATAPVWSEATRNLDPFACLMWLDAQLVGGGFPAMSPWWR